MSTEPPFVIHERDVTETEGRYPPPFDAEGLGLGRDLGRAAGSRRLGVWRDRLAPGHRTSRPHAHLREEELVYVLAGTPELRWWPPGEPEQITPLQTGHLVSFPAGTGIAHCFTNPGPEDAVLLVVGERAAGERIAYPEDAELEAWRASQHSMRRWPDRLGAVGQGRPPAFRIETERVVLVPAGPDHVLDQVAAIRGSHAHLASFMAFAREIPSVDVQLSWAADALANFLRGQDFNYVVRLPDGPLIGGTGLHRRGLPGTMEIGYWVAAEHQGKGYVTEWTSALCRVATEVMGARRVTIHHDVTNERSARVPERLGFTREGLMRGVSTRADGTVVDAVLWSWLPSDRSERVPPTPMRAWDAVGRRLL